MHSENLEKPRYRKGRWIISFGFPDLAITDAGAQQEFFKRALAKWPKLNAPLKHDSVVAEAQPWRD
jgi:hypothetical protein